MDRYSPLIREWCRRWFPNAADDMAHEVMVKLVFSMRSYTYQPELGRFRGWLKAVTYNMMVDLRRRSRRVVVDLDALDRALARNDLNARLADEFDLELLEEAKQKVRDRVEPRTWSVYVQTAEQSRRPAEVAREFGMPVGAVYKAKCVVLNALREQVKARAGAC